MHVCVCVHVFMCMYACVCVCACIHVHVCMCVCAYMCMHMCVSEKYPVKLLYISSINNTIGQSDEKLKYTIYTVTNHIWDLLSANMESATRNFIEKFHLEHQTFFPWGEGGVNVWAQEL